MASFKNDFGLSGKLGDVIIYRMGNNSLFDESAFRALFYFFQELLVHMFGYLVISTKIINFFIKCGVLCGKN